MTMRFCTKLKTISFLGLLLLGAPALATAPEAPAATIPAIDEPLFLAVQRPAETRRASLEVRLVSAETKRGVQEVAGLDGKPLYLEKESVLRASDVARVEVVPEPDLKHWAVTLHFSAKGAKRLHAATAKNLGRQLAVLVDGKVWFVAVIPFPLDASMMISQGYTRAEAITHAEPLAP